LGSKGTTAGRGQKGQTSRSGVGGLKRLGMRHIILATPKNRGFTSPHGKAQIVNLKSLDSHFVANEVVTPSTLAQKGLVRDANRPVKILAQGDLKVAIIIKNCQTSAAVQAKVTQAGGKVED
jgi:large subunit ribosomal protein L15